MNEFQAHSFIDFRTNFLIEKDLDRSPQIGLGELSRSLSKTNREVAQKLNGWAASISNKIQRYAYKVAKRQKRNGIDSQINIRNIPVSDGKSGEAAIIVIKLVQTENVGNGEIEISIFDNNKFIVQMTDSIANLVGSGNQKVITNKDKVANFVIGILERS